MYDTTPTRAKNFRPRRVDFKKFPNRGFCQCAHCTGRLVPGSGVPFLAPNTVSGRREMTLQKIERRRALKNELKKERERRVEAGTGGPSELVFEMDASPAEGTDSAEEAAFLGSCSVGVFRRKQGSGFVVRVRLEGEGLLEGLEAEEEEEERRTFPRAPEETLSSGAGGNVLLDREPKAPSVSDGCCFSVEELKDRLMSSSESQKTFGARQYVQVILISGAEESRFLPDDHVVHYVDLVEQELGVVLVVDGTT